MLSYSKYTIGRELRFTWVPTKLESGSIVWGTWVERSVVYMRVHLLKFIKFTITLKYIYNIRNGV